jgi:hypothetical protein
LQSAKDSFASLDAAITLRAANDAKMQRFLVLQGENS